MVDVKFDGNEELFVVGNALTNGGAYGGPVNGLVMRLDITSGSVNYSQYIDGHVNYIDNHTTQVFLDEEYYYLCGFANDGVPSSSIAQNGSMSSLHPLILRFERSDNDAAGGYIVDGDNADYGLNDRNVGYLGINYNPLQIQVFTDPPPFPYVYVYSNNFNEFLSSAKPEHLKSIDNSDIYTFPIYFPSSWYQSTTHGFMSTVLEYAPDDDPIYQTPGFGPAVCTWFPAIYRDLENLECLLYEETPVNQGTINISEGENLLILIKPSHTSRTHDTILSGNHILPMTNCPSLETLPEFRENDLYENQQKPYFLEQDDQGNVYLNIKEISSLISTSPKQYIVSDLLGRVLKEGVLTYEEQHSKIMLNGSNITGGMCLLTVYDNHVPVQTMKIILP